MSNHIATKDLCCAAYLLSNGLKLQDLVPENQLDFEKQTVNFLFSGSPQTAHKLLEIYRTGKATVHLAAFWDAYKYLKNELFQELRRKKGV